MEKITQKRCQRWLAPDPPPPPLVISKLTDSMIFFWHPSIRGLLDGARRAVSTCDTIHTVSEGTDKIVADEKSLDVKGLGEK